MYAMFAYDVPEKAKAGNPSWFLRKLGYRINLSVWIIHEKNVPRAAKFADELRGKGVVVQMREFSPKEEKELRQDALEAVQRDLGDLTQSIEERIKKGEAKLEEAKKLQAVDATNEAIRWVRSHLAYIQRALNASVEASTAFGILADLKEYYDAFTSVIAAATKTWVLEKAVKKANESAAKKKAEAKPKTATAKKATAKEGVA